jgi:rare lipoprotein A (peptidoglycan hydrolase)
MQEENNKSASPELIAKTVLWAIAIISVTCLLLFGNFTITIGSPNKLKKQSRETNPTKFNYQTSNSLELLRKEGGASYYDRKAWEGRITASYEKYDDTKLTAAHKTLPFGTYVKVWNLETMDSVIVRINDRGPYIAGRIIDLSGAAAEKLSMIDKGVIEVKIEIIDKEEKK